MPPRSHSIITGTYLGMALAFIAFAPDSGANPATPTAGASAWEKMSVPGATVAFEMPKPVKMNSQPEDGMVVYASQKEKMSFKVGILKRDYEKDKAKGVTDASALENFSLRVLAASKLSFKQMGLESKFEYVCELDTPTGKGKQFQAKVGKAFVINRFYINQKGLYLVEAISQDVNNADFNRFLNSFRP